VLCLDYRGNLTTGERTPKALFPGDRLIVRSIGTIGPNCEDDQLKKAQAAVALEVTSEVSHDTQFAASTPKASTKEAGCHTYDILREATFDVPTTAGLAEVIVHFSWKQSTKTIENTERLYHVPVEHGHYFFEVGVMVPFVLHGSRRVVAVPDPGTGEQVVAIQTDTHVTAAIMLNVFPLGGRANDRLYTGWAPRNWGVQFGVDLDFSDLTDQFYVGLLVEPVTGVSLNAGVAVLRGQFLPDGSQPGMLAPVGQPISTVNKYMARAYFGVTFTFDVVRTLLSAANTAKSFSITR
jgi:hypothetical protein